MTGLTAEQQAFFADEGYLVLPNVLSATDLQPAIDDIERAAEEKASELVAACHPPEADFLVRRTLRPDEVLETAAQFAQLRANHVPTPSTDRWGSSDCLVPSKAPTLIEMDTEPAPTAGR